MLQQHIRAELIQQNYHNEQAIDAVMKVVNKHWKEIYNDGGINPIYKDEIQLTGVEFDNINAIVQDITA